MPHLFMEEIDTKTWILIAVFGISLIIQLYYYYYYYFSVLCLKRKIKKGKVSFKKKKPGVSVIICAKNEADNLKEFLPSILEQKYPEFEVIVVNDGSTDYTEDTLLELEKKYPHLYHTNIPEDTKIKSAKKLALTIGIKAAKNNILLFTDADCKAISEEWISKMVRNFNDHTDFVLGYGAYEQKKGILSHLISYDTFFIAMQYLGFAYRGKTYMGVGRNMAYRKEVFFNNKGFARILHLQSGDDDLFVNRAANSTNTAIEIAPESTTISTIKDSFKAWYIQKERHLSTGIFYKKRSKNTIGIEVFSRGLFYVSFLMLLITLTTPLIFICIGLFLLRFLSQLLTINLTAKHFNERKFYLSTLIFDIFLPLINLYILTRNGLKKDKDYNWK